MAAGCGEVVVGGARALCVMSLCSISARMASRGAARRAHSTQMCRIAALPGSGGSTGAITHLSSAWCYFLAVSSWRRLSLANAISPNVAPRSASFWRRRSSARVIFPDTAGQSTNSWQLCSTADTDSTNAAAHAADSWRRCDLASSANDFSCAAVLWQLSCRPCRPTLFSAWPPHGNVAPRSMPFPPTLQHAVPSCDNVAPWQAPVPPMLQLVWLPHGSVAPWRAPVPPTLQLVRPPRDDVTPW